MENQKCHSIMREISAAYKSASGLTRQSLWLDQMGIRPKKRPIVPPEEMEKIDWMLYETRKGFQLTQFATDNPKKQLNELEKYPIEDGVVTQAKVLMGLLRISESVPESSWLALQQFKLTLNTLLSVRSFSYVDLPVMDEQLNLGEQELTITRWNHPNNSEFMWSFMNRIQQVIAESSRGEVDNPNEVIKTSHFFARGAQLMDTELG